MNLSFSPVLTCPVQVTDKSHLVDLTIEEHQITRESQKTVQIRARVYPVKIYPDHIYLVYIFNDIFKYKNVGLLRTAYHFQVDIREDVTFY